MKQLLLLYAVVAGSCSQIMAQETDLKEVYTDVTTKINSSLLTRKGAFELNGYIFYDRLKMEYSEGNENREFIDKTFQADAGVSYFIENQLSLGIVLSYFDQKRLYSTIQQTMTGPIVKLYFGEKRWRPYLFVDYLFINGDVMDGGETDIGAGILYHLTGNFGISFQLKYGVLSADEENTEGFSRMFIGFGIVNFIL
jgi:hypothetical protein